jgi:predicted house-cleaning noncanonical NTP pyrophosphatase (MazG superfamily)
MKRIYYNKLIRDLVPKKIKDKGSSLKTRTLSQKEFKIELLKKLAEETSGVMNSTSNIEIAEELGDVLDVIDEIKKTFKISPSLLKKTRHEAARKKGGFKKKIYLVWSADDGYKTNETRKN